MDSTALSLCMDNGLPIYVFNMDDERNIDRIVSRRAGGDGRQHLRRRMELIDELLEDAGERMTKSVEATRNEFATVRTGRASPHLLDRIRSTTTARDAAQASWRTSPPPRPACSRSRRTTRRSIKAIEKAIMESDLGLTPDNDGNVIRLEIPSSPRSAARSS